MVSMGSVLLSQRAVSKALNCSWRSTNASSSRWSHKSSLKRWNGNSADNSFCIGWDGDMIWWYIFFNADGTLYIYFEDSCFELIPYTRLRIFSLIILVYDVSAVILMIEKSQTKSAYTSSYCIKIRDIIQITNTRNPWYNITYLYTIISFIQSSFPDSRHFSYIITKL